jgi:hypothetical protein
MGDLMGLSDAPSEAPALLDLKTVATHVDGYVLSANGSCLPHTEMEMDYASEPAKSESSFNKDKDVTMSISISDFSPSQDHHPGGGTKVLICLSGNLPVHIKQSDIRVSI